MNKYILQCLLRTFSTTLILVGVFRGRIVQTNDNSMNIGTHGNVGPLILKQSGPILDFVQEGRCLHSKMADIENFNLLYMISE